MLDGLVMSGMGMAGCITWLSLIKTLPPQTQWLKTISIFFFKVSVGQEFRSGLLTSSGSRLLRFSRETEPVG